MVEYHLSIASADKDFIKRQPPPPAPQPEPSANPPNRCGCHDIHQYHRSASSIIERLIQVFTIAAMLCQRAQSAHTRLSVASLYSFHPWIIMEGYEPVLALGQKSPY
jgi:hypothetical protein